jgi:hypothetical protein
MAENTSIEWCDHIDRNATGRKLGAYKTAAGRTGSTVEEWMQQRANGNLWCFRCRSWKTGDLFSVDKSRRGGKSSSCKECTSDASTASRYGMSLSELNEFRNTHRHECGICAATEIVYIDHDHQTGRPRGLLCPSCNSAIGLLAENPERFAAALAYLEKHRGS